MARTSGTQRRSRTVRAGGFVLWALAGLAITTLVLVYAPGCIARPAAPSPSLLRTVAAVTFVLDLTLVASVVCGFGYAVTGYPSGIAMSSWNDYSLSKLQMALWTIVVLAGLLTIAKIRLLGYFPTTGDALDIKIPGTLLAAMGIATFTTAATPAILALKSSQEPAPGELNAARQRLDAAGDQSTAQLMSTGKAVGRASRDSASWLDIITGDETANAGTVDLSKVQQLLITLLLLGVYVGMLINKFASADTTKGADFGGIPELSDYFVGLMAVSHAGYLAYKVAPKSGQATGAAPPAQSKVTMRLAVNDAGNLTGLQLEVDGASKPIGPDGKAEIELDTGALHVLAIRGTRAGRPVTGRVLVTPTLDDLNKPIAVSLS